MGHNTSKGLPVIKILLVMLISAAIPLFWSIKNINSSDIPCLEEYMYSSKETEEF